MIFGALIICVPDQGTRGPGASLANVSRARPVVAAALLSKPAQAGLRFDPPAAHAIESLIRNIPMSKRALLSGLALAISLSAAFTAQADNEQYFPLQSYRVGPYAAGGTGFFRWLYRLPQVRQCQGWGQRRQADLERVRNRIRGREGRGVLRAPEKRPRWRAFRRHQSAVGGHCLRHPGALDRGQAAADHHQPWPYRFH